MSKALIVPATLAIVLASAGVSLAQQTGTQSQYDRTGDHMMSYGPTTQTTAPTTTRPASAPRVRNYRAPARQTQTQQTQAPIDRTGDHMFSYGPTAR
jgi:hypothetical protein